MNGSKISPIVSVNLPGSAPFISSCTPHARITVKDPILTVEMQDGIYFVATRFKLDIRDKKSDKGYPSEFLQEEKEKCISGHIYPESWGGRCNQAESSLCPSSQNPHAKLILSSGPSTPNTERVNMQFIEENICDCSSPRWQWTANIVNVKKADSDFQDGVSFIVSIRRQYSFQASPEDLIKQPFTFDMKLDFNQGNPGWRKFPLNVSRNKPYSSETFSFQIPEVRDGERVSSLIQSNVYRNQTIVVNDALDLIPENPPFLGQFQGHFHPLMYNFDHFPAKEDLRPIDSRVVL